MNWYDPSGWLDLLDHAWYGLVLIAVAAVPSWFAARNKREIKSVYDSINNRPTSIRDDLDRAINAIESMRHDVRALRQDLALEEDRRRAAVSDLYAELDHRTGRHRRQEQ